MSLTKALGHSALRVHRKAFFRDHDLQRKPHQHQHSRPQIPPPIRQARHQAQRHRLAKVRVPLHRRGTSNIYERLEAFLKEAGYKETRGSTPEGERAEEDGVTQFKRHNRISGTSAVVGFLAGLMPNNAANSHSRPAN